MQTVPSNRRSAALPKGRGLNIGNKAGLLTDEIYQSVFPKMEVLDEDSGELSIVYQYKGRFKWKPEFIKNKDHYNYPDYLIIKEYHRKHGKYKNVKFTDMLREFILTREFRCREITIYDNTGMIPANIMYYSILDLANQKMDIQINYLFPNRPNYKIHPRSK